MRQIEKHTFEAVSLLTVDNGLLDITVVPAIDQPDWLVPTKLILSVDEYHDYIWTYLWNNQEVAVQQLLPRKETPDKIIVLEGNTTVHRIGLLTKGELKQLQVNISDVKDIEKTDLSSPVSQEATDPDEKEEQYVFQWVKIGEEVFIVPDLDTLAHHLVDLDSY